MISPAVEWLEANATHEPPPSPGAGTGFYGRRIPYNGLLTRWLECDGPFADEAEDWAKGGLRDAV